MSSFEGVFAEAAELHAAAVARGADPGVPSSLVRAAATHLELEIVSLPPEHPLLHGAKAVLDLEAGDIRVSNSVASEEWAELLSHEVGHACLHPLHSGCDDSDVDASRSTEAAPMGLQRVEDYGTHERRELQANVFAREFLFPRAMARRLHVDSGETAMSIATRLGLRLDLVRQQVLDVLLPLPERDDVPAAPAAVIENSSQDRAVAHRDAPFQLQAGPGTGKTKTLVRRVEALLAEGVDPATILVLTFSNRAAGELSDRLTTTVPDASPKIWIGTFHAFGLDIVRRYAEQLGLPPRPQLFDRSDAIEMLAELLPILPLRHYRDIWAPENILREMLGAISRAKDELVDADGYVALGEAMRSRARSDEERERAEKCIEVGVVYQHCERALRQRGAVDFGDLIMRPALLLEGDEVAREAARARHRHILVDEYQDVNRASARFVRAIAGDGSRLWVVGDSRQSIYRFRGASSANMALFATDYPSAVVGRLDTNYRSSSEVITTFSHFAGGMHASRGMLPLQLRPTRSRGPRAQARRFASPEHEVGGIAHSIRELEATGVKLRDQAVLCRSNRRLAEIAEGLEARGIPVLHLGSLFERDEVRDLLALLTLLVDRFGDGLVRVGAMPRYSMAIQDVRLACEYLRAGEGPAAGRLVDAATNSGVSAAGAASLTRLAADLAVLPPRATPWEALTTYLLDRTRLVADLAGGASVSERMKALAVWQLLNFTREYLYYGQVHPIRRMLERIRNMVLLAEERDLRQVPAAALDMNAVRLMTVHGSKGLEFEAVHIPGMTAASFPANNQGQRCPPPDGLAQSASVATGPDERRRAHAEEEECLFFVALSRSRHHLRLYLSTTQPGGKARSESDFLGTLHGLLDAVPSAPVQARPPTSLRPDTIPVGRVGGVRVSERGVVAYEKCPRRFFYTHVLGLGAARQPTPVSRVQDCIYEVQRWFAAERVARIPAEAEAVAQLERIWTTKGPVGHAYETEYQRIAKAAIAALARNSSHRVSPPSDIPVSTARGTLLVRPDESVVAPGGRRLLRRVRLGHERSDEFDRLEYTMYLAAAAIGGVHAEVEALFLTQGVVRPVTLTAKKLATRREKVDGYIAAIADGEYPAQIDATACPRCPHFFVCGRVPNGTLEI